MKWDRVLVGLRQTSETRRAGAEQPECRRVSVCTQSVSRVISEERRDSLPPSLFLHLGQRGGGRVGGKRWLCPVQGQASLCRQKVGGSCVRRGASFPPLFSCADKAVNSRGPLLPTTSRPFTTYCLSWLQEGGGEARIHVERGRVQTEGFNAWSSFIRMRKRESERANGTVVGSR